MRILHTEAKESSKKISAALNAGVTTTQAEKGLSTLTTQLKQLGQTAKIPATNYKVTAEAINKANSKLRTELGLTSKEFTKLNEKMLRTTAMKTSETAMRNIARVADLSAKEVKQLAIQMGYTGKQATKMASNLTRAKNRMKSFGASASALQSKLLAIGLAAATGAYAIKRMSEAIWEAGIATKIAENAYKEITGSVENANVQFEFIAKTSAKLGLNFYTMRDSYKGFLAAAQYSKIPMQEIQAIFESVSNAGAILGLSNERMKLSFLALEQMMSKGKVSMEEIRRQLGDNIPGAFQLGAKAMGMTVEAFDKAVSAGTVFADDFLPKFRKAMDESYVGTIDESVKAANKLAEAWEALKNSMADSGFLSSIARAMGDVTKTFKDPEVIQGMKEFAYVMGKTIEYMAKIPAAMNFIKMGLSFGYSGASGTEYWDELDKKRMESISKLGGGTSYIIGQSPNEIASEKAKEIAMKEGLAIREALMETYYEGELKKVEANIEAFTKGEKAKAKAAKERIKAEDKANTKIVKDYSKMVDDRMKDEQKWAEGVAEAHSNMYENLSEMDKEFREDSVESALSSFFGDIESVEDELKKVEKAHEKTASEIDKVWEHTVDNIQDAFADGIYDMLDGGLNSFEDFADKIGEIFKKQFANLAAYDIMAALGLSSGGGVGMFSGGASGTGLLGSLGLSAGKSAAGNWLSNNLNLGGLFGGGASPATVSAMTMYGPGAVAGNPITAASAAGSSAAGGMSMTSTLGIVAMAGLVLDKWFGDRNADKPALSFTSAEKGEDKYHNLASHEFDYGLYAKDFAGGLETQKAVVDYFDTIFTELDKVTTDSVNDVLMSHKYLSVGGAFAGEGSIKELSTKVFSELYDELLVSFFPDQGTLKKIISEKTGDFETKNKYVEDFEDAVRNVFGRDVENLRFSPSEMDAHNMDYSSSNYQTPISVDTTYQVSEMAKIFDEAFFKSITLEGGNIWDSFTQFGKIVQENSNFLNDFNRQVDEFGESAKDAFNNMVSIASIMDQVSYMELSDVEKATLAINTQFDGMVATLTALHGTEEQIARVEALRTKGLEDLIAVSEEERKRISEKASLEKEYLVLIGDTVALRALELAELDPSNWALQKRIWAIEDANDAVGSATEAEKALTEARENSITSIEDLIKELEGGSLSPVQSMEYFKKQYDDAFSAVAMAETPEELQTAVEGLDSPVTDYLDMAQDYGGNYQDLFDSAISRLDTTKDSLPMWDNTPEQPLIPMPVADILTTNGDDMKEITALLETALEKIEPGSRNITINVTANVPFNELTAEAVNTDPEVETAIVRIIEGVS